MRPTSGFSLLGLAVAISLGLAGLGYLLGRAAIEPRDTNNPQLKKVRVVSTVEYYLSD